MLPFVMKMLNKLGREGKFPNLRNSMGGDGNPLKFSCGSDCTTLNEFTKIIDDVALQVNFMA